MLDTLKHGREAYHRRAWADAYASLSVADQTCPLGAEDLELLGTSAYLTGRDLDFQRILERAHHAHVAAPFEFQLADPERLRREFAAAGLKKPDQHRHRNKMIPSTAAELQPKSSRRPSRC